MTDPLAITLLLGVFFLLLIIKVPVAFCLALSSFVTAAYMNIPLGALTQKMISGVDSFSLLAIPFFILAGEIMGAGGISERLVKMANVLVDRVRGGLGCVSVVESTFFASIQGSVVANIASTGPIELRMMRKQGYPDTFSVPVIISSSCQSVLIPPSHNMIIFASAVGGLSIGKLFMAGLFPGLLLGLTLLIQVYVTATLRKYPKGGVFGFKEGLRIIAECIPALMTMVIIIGGVFGGFVTANESAVIACVYAFIIALFYYKGMKIRDIPPILVRMLKTLAMVFALISASSAFGYMMTVLRIPTIITETLLNISDNRIILLLLVNLALLLMGAVMDMAPLILIAAPILMPVVTSPVIGMDPIQFGVVMLFNLSLGLITPPVGTALFVGSGISGLKIEKLAVAMLPFYGTFLVVLMLLTFIPEISMFIPNRMFGS